MPPANSKTPPLDGCCDVVKKSNIPCLCFKVTKEINKAIGMEKVVFIVG